ncbi:MAG: carboxypeptidase M32 [Bdellovibrionales bacterium]|nr:carboxypeptidase M32 [Bdellovibrionales bacterium]
MMTSYEKLEARFLQISRLNDARSILGWDEAVMMPTGSSDSRNQTLAELAGVIQNLSISPEIGDWLGEAEGDPQLLPAQKANVREMKRIYTEMTAVPSELNQKLVVARMTSEQKWRTLRGQNDWAGFMPYMEEVLKLTREATRLLAEKRGLSLYDAALSTFSNGLTTQVVEKLFTEIKSFLPDTINAVLHKQKSETVIMPEGSYPIAAQKALAKELMGAVGFNFENGRLDESHHPFCGGTQRDVRITTRYSEKEFLSALMGVLHETGHAMYEQHLPLKWLGQPVGAAAGMAIHESQSLLMEMQVSRSAEFMHFAGPAIRKHFAVHTKNPEALSDENLAKLVTRVKRGYIRVDADEVTYPAHVILRFELERDLLEDRLQVKDVPAAWNEKMKAYLGLSTEGNYKDGCMQDVHWPAGLFGYFPAYTFGAIIAAQFFARIEQVRPGVRSEIAKGNLSGVQSWLTDNVWSKGSELTTLDLVTAVSEPLSVASFRAHIQKRYLS